ncbi:hypothetical protein EH223_05010 [candidate division KSB1 bacterium]|nr:hypothetical protein [candidate division KSB1 bacterium]RQW05396.1 MAG: hypothetical protein EH223_05010 [candidate division KSB1 bacterium]
MASLLDSIRDGLELVVDKTEEYSKIGKLKVDILTIKRKIEKQFTELGGRTYDILTGEDAKSLQKDEEVKKITDDIQALEAQLKEKEAEIEKVKEEKEKERQERQEARKKQADVKVTDDEEESINSEDIEDAKIVQEKKKQD